jgi:hypothetical protein
MPALSPSNWAAAFCMAPTQVVVHAKAKAALKALGRAAPKVASATVQAAVRHKAPVAVTAAADSHEGGEQPPR